MALDPQYVPAIDLQEPLVDKDTGELLAAGVVTSYRDSDRSPTGLKSLYVKTGTPPDYTYVALPNPFTLSSIGTFVYLGADIVPYYKITDDDGNLDLYYLDVKSAGAVNQFTRKGVPNETSEVTDVTNDDNYFLNAQFRLYDDQSQTINTTDPTQVAFSWTFEKSNTSATDTVSIEDFPISELDAVEGTPTKFLKFECTATGTGETFKRIYYTIPDVTTFSTKTIRFALVGQSTDASNINIKFIQNYGSGGSSEDERNIGSFALNTSFSEHRPPAFSVPDISAKTVGTDSYVRIVIELPINQESDVNITNLQLNLGEDILPYKYVEYPTNKALTLGSLLPKPENTDIGSVVEWNGIAFVLNRLGAGRGHRSGFVLSNNTTDPLNDIDISAGEWRSNDNTVDISTTTTFTKQADVTWALGTNQGGVAAGALPATNGEWLHKFAIGNSTQTLADFIWDTDINGTNVLADASVIAAGLTKLVRIGSNKRTVGLTTIEPFTMSEIGNSRTTYWSSMISDHTTGVGSTAILVTHRVPPSVRVEAIVNINFEQVTGGFLHVSSPDQPDVAPSNTIPRTQLAANSVYSPVGEVRRITDTNQELRYRANTNGCVLRVATYGWIE